MLARMQWDDLRLLLAIDRSGTLSAAGRELGVNHSTVSRRLAALEEELGCRLFDRQDRVYVATVAGEDMLSVANRIEDELQALDRRVLGRDDRLSGTLRVTTLDFLAMRFVEAFRDFSVRYPNVDLELSADNQPRSLSKREADVALRFTVGSPPEHLVGRRLCRVEFALYGARSLVGDGTDVDLEALPWMGWDDRAGARLTERWMKTHVPRARVAARVDSTLLFMESIRVGMGIAFLPCFEGERMREVVRLRPLEPDFGMDFWALTHPDLRSSARVRAFMDHMTAVIKPLQAEYAGEGVSAA